MTPATLDKYRRILQADPRSRIFVELARALLESGEPAEAAVVCERGLEHHPDSIQGTALLCRALLAAGRRDDAVARIAGALAAQPLHPSVHEVLGEALAAGLAEPLREPLARAAESTGDRRLRKLLEDAVSTSLSADERADGASGAGVTPGASPEGGAGSSGAGARPAAGPVRRPVARMIVRGPETVEAHLPGDPSATVALEIGPAPSPTPVLRHGVPPPAAEPEGPAAAPSDDPFAEFEGSPRPPARDPFAAATPAAPSADPFAPPPLSVPPPRPPRRDSTASRPLEPSVLDLLPSAQPAALRRDTTRGLAMLRPELVQEATAPAADREREKEAVRTYEHELRERLGAELKKPSFLRRHAWATAIAVLTLVAAGAAGAYAVVRARHRVGDARAAVAAARQGLARDTVGALREAAKVLSRARRVLTLPDDGGAAALEAEVAALLAHDHGDGAAAALARGLVDGGLRGPGAAGVRYLLANPDEVKGAAAALLEHAEGGTSLERALAGEVLLARRELGAAEKHLAAAAGATPPSMRALFDLGELEQARGDQAAALARYELVLRAVPHHPGAALGAAEAQLALHGDLAGALRTLDAALHDPASAPPLGLRLRAELARARLLAATGRGADAEAQLDASAAREPGSPEIEAARAEVRAAAGDLDGAVQAASDALQRDPENLVARERLAELQLRRELWRPLLATTENGRTRALHLARGVALLQLGEADRARAELEATRLEGRMTAEAAGWMAVAELTAGHRAQAASIVGVLMAAPQPHAVALYARARLDLAGHDEAAAERHLQAALDRDPELAVARRELARVLIDRRRAADARDVLQRLVAASPWDVEARRLYDRALQGDPPVAPARKGPLPRKKR